MTFLLFRENTEHQIMILQVNLFQKLSFDCSVEQFVGDFLKKCTLTKYVAWYKGFQSQRMLYFCQICNDLKTGQEFESIEIEIVRNKIQQNSFENTQWKYIKNRVLG